MPSLIKRAKGWRSRHTDFSGPPSGWRSCHTDFWARQVVGGAAIRIFGLAKWLAEPPYGFLGSPSGWRSRHTDFWARQVVGGVAIRIFQARQVVGGAAIRIFGPAKGFAGLPHGSGGRGLRRPKLFVHLGINCNLKYHEKNFMGPFGLLVGDGRGNGKRYR